MKNYEDQVGDETAKVLKLRNELTSSRKERQRAEEEVSQLQVTLIPAREKLAGSHPVIIPYIRQ